MQRDRNRKPRDSSRFSKKCPFHEYQQPRHGTDQLTAKLYLLLMEPECSKLKVRAGWLQHRAFPRRVGSRDVTAHWGQFIYGNGWEEGQQIPSGVSVNVSTYRQEVPTSVTELTTIADFGFSIRSAEFDSRLGRNFFVPSTFFFVSLSLHILAASFMWYQTINATRRYKSGRNREIPYWPDQKTLSLNKTKRVSGHGRSELIELTR